MSPSPRPTSPPSRRSSRAAASAPATPTRPCPPGPDPGHRRCPEHAGPGADAVGLGPAHHHVVAGTVGWNETHPRNRPPSTLARSRSGPARRALHEDFARRYDRIRRGTQRALEETARAGHLAEGADRESAAAELTALMNGLQVMWLLTPKAVDMAGQLRAAIQRLLVVPL
ncbi:TetR family transcriptional regulator C-terminal domain-containing protein [Streptomyces sp. NPDC001027]|uniref:TetR family transcriptional regulator C-terminal domain-containing protein n=1 Tax=Streptomyces sp. NPDC001027 TaxID=3154771 RepID=UPI00332956C9